MQKDKELSTMQLGEVLERSWGLLGRSLGVVGSSCGIWGRSWSGILYTSGGAEESLCVLVAGGGVLEAGPYTHLTLPTNHSV